MLFYTIIVILNNINTTVLVRKWNRRRQQQIINLIKFMDTFKINKSADLELFRLKFGDK